MLPEAAVEILLGVAAVILAIVLFIAVYNIVFGGSAIEDDAKTLAAIIAEMADSDLQYEQASLLLRVDDNWILGYDNIPDSSISVLTYEPSVQRYTFSRPIEKCPEGTECICSAANQEHTETECFPIKREGYSWLRQTFGSTNGELSAEPAIPLHLVSNYEGVYIGLSSKTVPRYSASPFNDGRESHFVAAARMTNALRSGLGGQVDINEETQAVMPVIIEKRIVNGPAGKAVVITLLPDTTSARNRFFYYQVCQPTEGSDERCDGLTGYSSTAESTVQATGSETVSEGIIRVHQRYCAAGFDNECNIVPLRECTDGEEVREPCLCGNTAVTWGVCSSGEHSRIACDAISSCSDYCKYDGSAPDGNLDTLAELGHCTPAETITCASNPCDLDVLCGSQLDESGQAWCRTADDAREQDLRGIAAAVESLLDGQVDLVAVALDTQGRQLVGFGNSHIVTALPLEWTADPVPRPQMCMEHACVCLSDDGQAVTCAVIAANNQPIDIPIRNSVDGVFYLERTESDGMTSIFIRATELLQCGEGNSGACAHSCSYGTTESEGACMAGRCCVAEN